MWIESDLVLAKRDRFGRLPKGAKRVRRFRFMSTEWFPEGCAARAERRRVIPNTDSDELGIIYEPRTFDEEEYLHRTIPDWHYAVTSFVSLEPSASSGGLTDSVVYEPNAVERFKSFASRVGKNLRESLRGVTLGKEVVNRITSINIPFVSRTEKMTRSEGEERPWEGPRPGRKVSPEGSRKVELTLYGKVLKFARTTRRAAKKIIPKRSRQIRVIPLVSEHTPELSWAPTSRCMTFSSFYRNQEEQSTGCSGSAGPEMESRAAWTQGSCTWDGEYGYGEGFVAHMVEVIEKRERAFQQSNH